jgi:hypothetical protein
MRPFLKMFLSLELTYSEDFGSVAQANTLSTSPFFNVMVLFYLQANIHIDSRVN